MCTKKVQTRYSICCKYLLLRFSKRSLFESGFEFCFNDVLDFGLKDFLIVFLIFKIEKSEGNFLSEGMDILISPLITTWTPNTSKEMRRGNAPKGS